MKNQLIVAFLFILAMAGCKKEPAPTQASPSAGQFPGTASNQAAVAEYLTKVAASQPPPPSEWVKVKVSQSGEILWNNKTVTLAGLGDECAQLKKVNGAILIYFDSPNHQPTPPQVEIVKKITSEKVGMKLALKESELD